ncbi:hypothetical protein PSPO01_04829 [Paraphaeosphaeria sporulosa]
MTMRRRLGRADAYMLHRGPQRCAGQAQTMVRTSAHPHFTGTLTWWLHAALPQSPACVAPLEQPCRLCTAQSLLDAHPALHAARCSTRAFLLDAPRCPRDAHQNCTLPPAVGSLRRRRASPAAHLQLLPPGRVQGGTSIYPSSSHSTARGAYEGLLPNAEGASRAVSHTVPTGLAAVSVRPRVRLPRGFMPGNTQTWHRPLFAEERKAAVSSCAGPTERKRGSSCIRSRPW